MASGPRGSLVMLKLNQNVKTVSWFSYFKWHVCFSAPIYAFPVWLDKTADTGRMA